MSTQMPRKVSKGNLIEPKEGLVEAVAEKRETSLEQRQRVFESLSDTLDEVAPIGPVDNMKSEDMERSGFLYRDASQSPEKVDDANLQIHRSVHDLLDDLFGKQIPVKHEDAYTGEYYRVGEGQWINKLKKSHEKRVRKAYRQLIKRDDIEANSGTVFVIGVYHSRNFDQIATMQVIGIEIPTVRIVLRDNAIAESEKFVSDVVEILESGKVLGNFDGGSLITSFDWDEG